MIRNHIALTHRPLYRMASLALAAVATGCASVAVTDDAIVAKTAHALGLERTAFTITERANDGMQTTYKATTSGGRVYSCYVTGSVSFTGRTVSDALCNEMKKGDGPAKPAPTPAANCNALLKAAGRC